MKKGILGLIMILLLISCGKNDDPATVNQTGSNTGDENTQVTPAPPVNTLAPGIDKDNIGPAKTISGTQLPTVTPTTATGGVSLGDTPSYTGGTVPAVKLQQIDPAKNAINAKFLDSKIKTSTKRIVLAKNQFSSSKSNIITLDNFKENQKLEKKAHITGKVPTNWVFEGSFPIKIIDDHNGVIFEGVGHANIFDDKGKPLESTEVNFTADFNLNIPALAKKGFIVLSSDNPSGLPENIDSAQVKITF